MRRERFMVGETPLDLLDSVFPHAKRFGVDSIKGQVRLDHKNPEDATRYKQRLSLPKLI